MSLLCCGLGMMSVQCDPQPSNELSALPVHELDFSSPAGGDPSRWPPRRRGAAQPGGEWAAQGYRPWRHIVIHHSATPRGSAGSFDRMHRARGWDELGYHFVIDNGDGGPDGRIEVGRRWRVQKWGAHCGGTPDNEYNNLGIGICLVGDFTRRRPSARQLASLQRLVNYLAAAYGIPPDRVVGHRDAPNAATSCPGAKLHQYLHATLRPRLARHLAAAK